MSFASAAFPERLLSPSLHVVPPHRAAPRVFLCNWPTWSLDCAEACSAVAVCVGGGHRSAQKCDSSSCRWSAGARFLQLAIEFRSSVNPEPQRTIEEVHALLRMRVHAGLLLLPLTGWSAWARAYVYIPVCVQRQREPSRATVSLHKLDVAVGGGGGGFLRVFSSNAFTGV